MNGKGGGPTSPLEYQQAITSQATLVPRQKAAAGKIVGGADPRRSVGAMRSGTKYGDSVLFSRFLVAKTGVLGTSAFQVSTFYGACRLKPI